MTRLDRMKRGFFWVLFFLNYRVLKMLVNIHVFGFILLTSLATVLGFTLSVGYPGKKIL